MAAPGRSALVTGAGSGIGRAIASQLAREGWGLGLLSRTGTELGEVADAIRGEGGAAFPLAADVLDPREIEQASLEFAKFSESSGEVALFCAAGRLRGIGPIEVVDFDSWWRDIETALKGTAQTIRAMMPVLKHARAASITVLIGPGHNGELAHASGYGSAQAGLVRLVETLGEELKSSKIPVFALNPGLVPTRLMTHLLDGPEGRRWLPRFTEAFAEGKEVGPEVAAEMAAWLADRRPQELNGRVVSALITPQILETRLDRIRAEDLNRLRLR